MAVSLVIIFFLLKGVQCRIYPYTFFMGQTLANHSYVDITRIGGNRQGNDSVQCITDLTSCCSHQQGSRRGDWYFPNGNRLPFSISGGIFENRESQRVDLRQFNNVNSPTGIYRCNIPTQSVHHPIDTSVRAKLYVGLYTSNEGNIIIQSIVYDSNRMTLTCISTGGPATTITWTKNSAPLTKGTETVLNDPINATYTHTLTLSNTSNAGEYICNISNNKPSSAAASYIICGYIASASPLTDVRAVQNSATTITVTWTSPPGDTSGYRISYTGRLTSTVTISGGSINNYTISHLQNGLTYHISVTAFVRCLYGPSVNATPVPLVPYSAAVIQTPVSVTSTTVRILWRVPARTVVTGFTIEWQRNISVGCSNTNHRIFNIHSTLTSYTITGFEPGNMYSITVRLFNNAGRGPVSNVVSAMTHEAVPGLPSFFNQVSATPNSITIRWGDINCLDQNGIITGFVITVVETGIYKSVDSNIRQTTITGLTPSTQYTFQIAAVNSAGRGLQRNRNYHTKAFLVTLEAPSYTVLEEDKTVEVCVAVSGINSTCPSSVPYQFTVTTTDKTAVSSSDYKAVNVGITLQSCEIRSCINITLINDDINEPKECFNISLTSSIPSITIIISRIAITIIDGDDKPTGVSIIPVSSLAVKISWSGSVHLSTHITYTVHYSTGIVQAQKEVVYGPNTTSAVFSLETKTLFENIYQHKFSLSYVFHSGIIHLTEVYFTPDIAHFQIQFGPYYHCLDHSSFGHVKNSIEEEIKSSIMKHIYNNCSQCNGLNEQFLASGFFLCHKSPTNTTYRSTLVNPFTTTTATQLVGIIQHWVTSGASLILEGHLVRVNENCQTEISSLDEEECESGVRDDPALGQRITNTLNVCAVRGLGDEICRM